METSEPTRLQKFGRALRKLNLSKLPTPTGSVIKEESSIADFNSYTVLTYHPTVEEGHQKLHREKSFKWPTNAL